MLQPNGRSSSSGLVWRRPNRILGSNAGETASRDSFGVKFFAPHLFGARNENFSGGDRTSNSAAQPFSRLGDSTSDRKSRPMVGIFGESPQIGEKQEWMVGATGIEPVTPTMSR